MTKNNIMIYFKCDELQNCVITYEINGTLFDATISIKDDLSQLLPFILVIGNFQFCYYCKRDRDLDYNLLIEYIIKRKKLNGIR